MKERCRRSQYHREKNQDNSVIKKDLWQEHLVANFEQFPYCVRQPIINAHLKELKENTDKKFEGGIGEMFFEMRAQRAEIRLNRFRRKKYLQTQ